MAIEWSQEYSVNVKEIDEQHKVFLSILKDLYNSIYQMDVEQNIDHIMAQVLNYIKFHFATEEKYFDMFSYDGKIPHIEAHREFESKIIEIRKNIEINKESPTVALADLMENWLVAHINSVDKKYTKCFNDHGLF